MAYYAALVSAVQLLKEISLSEYQYPKSLFETQQIKSLYEKLRHLQEVLEDHSPNDSEVVGFLDRIRDAACLAQHLIEFHIPKAPEINRSCVPILYREYYTTRSVSYIPDAVEEVKSIVELQIAEKVDEPSPIVGYQSAEMIHEPSSSYLECIHIVLSYFASGSRNSENANEKAVNYTLRRRYENLLWLTKTLGYVARMRYETLASLIKAVSSITMEKETQDDVKLEEEFNHIVINGYQDLLKLKEELDAIVEKEDHDFDTVKKALDSILGRGRQNVERVKEAFNFIAGKGYKYLLEKVKELVDLTVGRGFQNLEWLKKEVDSIIERGYEDWAIVKAEIAFVVIEGYQKSVKLKEELDAILGRCQILVREYEELDSISLRGYQDLERVNEEIDSIRLRGYQDLKRAREKIGLVVEKGYKFLFEKVKEEVDSIVKDLKKIKEKSHKSHQDDLQVGAEGMSTHGPSDRTAMVGFEQHLTTLKAQLCGESSRLEVISIVGMGGIGKTTLAKNIFDDKLIDDHFDFRVWITVSQSYYFPNILLAIANSLNINNGEDVLKDCIYKHLFGRRYLIIMDDVWDLKFWNDVRWIFPNDNKSRSRIIITTRQLDVASLASASDFINQIPILEYEQSWDLFCGKVFCPPELEDIGRLIVKNCRGLPLAIVVIAGLLSKVNKTQYDWKEVARGISSAAAKNDEHFSRILSLSYNYLPHHLKPCFLYFGGFPEDYEISVSTLVKLWVAEGFLKPIASMSLEEVAKEYLEELVKRNLVLITKRRSNGKFKCCNIHDLLRELCLERACCEIFLLLPHKHSTTGHIHRFFLHPNSSLNISLQEKKILHLRSILSFGETPCGFLSHPSNFMPLRVLHAPNSFPIDSNGNFEWLHLRYVLSPYLPPSIFKLQNLQTLIIVTRFVERVELPSEIWKMPRLRHVMIDHVILPPIPDGSRIIREAPLLRMLQTLHKVMDFRFSSSNVAMIPNLKKLKLKAYDCEPRRNYWAKYGLENLIHLHQLETLDIDFLFFIKNDDAIPFPVSFSFPLSLKKLSLEGCSLPWKDLTIVGSLPNLQVLKLRWRSFVGREWEPIEGEFAKLKYLLIDGLNDLEYWGAENTHFPCLEQLHISNFEKLEIPIEVGDIPTLQLIEVRYCSSFMETLAKEIQEEQLEFGNDGLQVRCIRK